MTAKEFLIAKLSELAILFPTVVIRYKYNLLIETHVVELSPVHEYYNNGDLDRAWIPLSLEFAILYPEEYVTFISTDSSLAICDAELEFNVSEFKDLKKSENSFYKAFLSHMINVNLKPQNFTSKAFDNSIANNYNNIIKEVRHVHQSGVTNQIQYSHDLQPEALNNIINQDLPTQYSEAA